MNRAPHALTFSIVVPTLNEAADISVTCDALLALGSEPEIIFVDGRSTDNTAELIRQRLLTPRMKLLAETKPGVSAARNTGVRAATGEVVVLLNADVRPSPDFLDRLSQHYLAGADYVSVDAEVSNLHSAYARFIDAQHKYLFGGSRPVGWTEGFSCRRALALSVGLFPEVLPGAGGEDVDFVDRLSAAASRGLVDKTIVVKHVTPASFREFWRQWQGRGMAVPFLRSRVHQINFAAVIVERVAASALSMVRTAIVLPVVWRAIVITQHSPRSWADWLPFVALSLVQETAHRIGEWKGLLRLVGSR